MQGNVAVMKDTFLPVYADLLLEDQRCSQLEDMIHRLPSQSSSTTASSQDVFDASPSSGDSSLNFCGFRVIEKNTFLDLQDDGLEFHSTQRRRSASVPPLAKLAMETFDQVKLSSSGVPLPAEAQQPTVRRASTSPIILSDEDADANSCDAAASGSNSHKWNVGAKKIRSSDKSMVSRSFDLKLGKKTSGLASFKLSLHAKEGNGRGSTSFRGSNGCGSVQLKCEDDLSNSGLGSFSFRFAIGSEGHETAARIMRHDFALSARCITVDWDFASAVSNANGTFFVSVEVCSEA